MSDTMSTDTTPSEADLAHLATQIRAAHEAVSTAATQADALGHAREAGRRLAEAKGLCGHGEWLPWLAANCPDIGARQVQKYMKLAANWDAIAPRLAPDSHLSIEGALRLLAGEAAEVLRAEESEASAAEVPTDDPVPADPWNEFAAQLAAVTAFARSVPTGAAPAAGEPATLVPAIEGAARALLGAAHRLRRNA